MASPMVEGRSLNPREKAHFSLHIGERIANGDASLGSFSSVKYNHKPSQTSSTRNTTLISTASDRYALKVQDKDGGRLGDVFTFTGQKTAPKKSYILLFDPTSQKATLEPLDSTYTFNLARKNREDVSSTHPKIYPRRQKDDASQDTQGGAENLFDEGGNGGHGNDSPDEDNPYDFRHFLETNKEKRSDESEYNIASSPDYRTGTGSAMNTPLMPARKPAAAVSSKPRASQPAPKARKRKSPEPAPLQKATSKKAQATPTVRLDRRASAHPKPESKPGRKAGAKGAAPPSSKIKSAEIVHSSDESDIDAEGEPASSPPPPPPPPQRSPERRQEQHVSDDDEEDEYEDHSMGGGLEIEVPDERPSKPRGGALSSLGLGQNIGLGSLSHLRSPSNGPISLASAANSVENSPDPRHSRAPKRTDEVIDFGDMGGDRGEDSEEEGGYEEDAEGEDEEMDDRDVEPINIGPPAQSASGRKMSVGGAALTVEEDEDDPLYKEMMEGLAGGDSSEESEEE